MITICSCAQVVCGGNHCPVGDALARVTHKLGRQPNLDDPCELELCLEEFYRATEGLYQRNCAFRNEERRRCCEGSIEVELRLIQSRGVCNTADPLQAPA